MAGQTINDRLLAARHSLAGQGLAKSVCKATTEEMIGPKKKHLDCKCIIGDHPIQRFSSLRPLRSDSVCLYRIRENVCRLVEREVLRVRCFNSLFFVRSLCAAAVSRLGDEYIQNRSKRVIAQSFVRISRHACSAVSSSHISLPAARYLHRVSFFWISCSVALNGNSGCETPRSKRTSNCRRG